MIEDPQIIERLTQYAFEEKEKGTDNSQIRNRLHHKGLNKDQIRVVMNEADDRLYASFEKKKSAKIQFGLDNKTKANLSIIIGVSVLILEFTTELHTFYIGGSGLIITGLVYLSEARREKYHRKFKHGSKTFVERMRKDDS